MQHLNNEWQPSGEGGRLGHDLLRNATVSKERGSYIGVADGHEVILLCIVKGHDGRFLVSELPSPTTPKEPVSSSRLRACGSCIH